MARLSQEGRMPPVSGWSSVAKGRRIMTQLEALLESIDPDRTLDETRRRADRALDSFHAGSGLIDNWNVFQSFMTRLHCHLNNTVLRTTSLVHPNTIKVPKSKLTLGR